ncbi:AEC family transporter [Streptomyces prasinus]|uniref:AEC family transporter n=1 Tax=Streptomyces prasinus TaxID=67345 RepID=UPI003688A035
MQGVLSGFAVIAVVIGVGYVIGRRGYLGEQARDVLTRLAFRIASPALLFTLLAEADLSSLVFSGRLLVTALSTAAVAGVFVAVGAVRRWGVGRTTIGALCSSYVNSGNLGIPIAVYVLGDASLVAPVLLFQLVMVAPVALTVLDLATSGEKQPLGRRLLTPLRNPVALGSLAGVAVAASGVEIPGPVMDPLILIGNMAVPAVLLAFGISLRGSAPPLRSGERGPVLLAVALKSVGQPVVAWALAVGVFGLRGAQLLDVVVTSALPAAQNLFTYASSYRVGETLAREAVLVSTLLSVPVLVVVAAVLG